MVSLKKGDTVPFDGVLIAPKKATLLEKLLKAAAKEALKIESRKKEIKALKRQASEGVSWVFLVLLIKIY